MIPKLKNLDRIILILCVVGAALVLFNVWTTEPPRDDFYGDYNKPVCGRAVTVESVVEITDIITDGSTYYLKVIEDGDYWGLDDWQYTSVTYSEDIKKYIMELDARPRKLYALASVNRAVDAAVSAHLTRFLSPQESGSYEYQTNHTRSVYTIDCTLSQHLPDSGNSEDTPTYWEVAAMMWTVTSECGGIQIADSFRITNGIKGEEIHGECEGVIFCDEFYDTDWYLKLNNTPLSTSMRVQVSEGLWNQTEVGWLCKVDRSYGVIECAPKQ